MTEKQRARISRFVRHERQAWLGVICVGSICAVLAVFLFYHPFFGPAGALALTITAGILVWIGLRNTRSINALYRSLKTRHPDEDDALRLLFKQQESRIRTFGKTQLIGTGCLITGMILTLIVFLAPGYRNMTGLGIVLMALGGLAIVFALITANRYHIFRHEIEREH